MKSGDKLLCSGNSHLSNAIKKMQRLMGFPEEESSISHVAGLFFVTPEVAHSLNLDFIGLGVFESTTFNKWADKKGVQLNEYNKWMQNYDGEVYLRESAYTMGYTDTVKDTWFVKNAVGKPYESGIMGFGELFFCGLGLDRAIRKVFPHYRPIETAEIHCTENEALRMINLEQFSCELYANKLPPAMWWRWLDEYIKPQYALCRPKQLK